jgi:N utilization substance protein B
MHFRKRKTREIAMQILFAWDTHGDQDMAMAHSLAADGSDEEETRDAAIELAKAAWGQHPALDQWIQRLAPRFALSRQPAVDRSLLRLAAWELTSDSAPPKVAIDEAVDMARQFSTGESAGFINAVLDAMLREHKALTGGAIVPQTPADPPAGSPPPADTAISDGEG